MGFSTCLQGRTAHDALLARQDAEVRLLETMRRCLASKVKADREYALALSAVAGQGLKFEQRTDEMSGSLVAAAWKTMMEEMDGTGRLIKQNADAVETKALDRLNAMCLEKRRARKQYHEEHGRISQQFTHLVDDVNRKKSEYQKYLELYKLMRSRFEEHYVKSGRGGRKLDEVRDKYQKACRKLHLTHNEYVLLLCEAAEHEKDFRTVLIPGLLEHQQAVQETFVASWRQVLQDVTQWSNLTSQKFREAQQRVETSLDALRPTEEYRDFTEKHRCSPVPVTTFTFDESLVEDTSGKLLANRLTVDNLTVEWLRNKQSELEAAIREGQDRQQSLLNQDVGTGGLVNGKTNNSAGTNPATTITSSAPPIPDTAKKEANELKCLERKMTRQVEVIKAALNDLGCEEVPSGCDLSIEHNSSYNTDNNGSSIITPENQVMTLDAGRSLADEEWFHGVLPREEVVRLLTRPGDFLVRETTRNDECQTVLSVCWDGHKHFIVQTTADGHYRFEGPEFPSVQELIQHQHKSGLPVTSKSGAVLRKPVFRERWELNNDDVLLQDKIGRGNFGDVYKAQLRSSGTEVAVKTCRVALPDEHKRKFLQEGRILKQYDHPNVVRLIGICVQKQPIMIVMELVPGGSLLAFLRAPRTVGSSSPTSTVQLGRLQLLAMCRDAAAGMRYLESKNCIHRDLAARNCLVGNDHSVKISDFGMSREEEEYIVSDGMKQIPIKWTAPEALNFGKYTSLCDVWSYGVLTWEIFSRGSTPYNGMSNSQARDKIDAGYRMPAPEGTPDEMYRLMLRCWEYKPEDRPNFKQIHTVVDTLYGALR